MSIDYIMGPITDVPDTNICPQCGLPVLQDDPHKVEYIGEFGKRARVVRVFHGESHYDDYMAKHPLEDARVQ